MRRNGFRMLTSSALTSHWSVRGCLAVACIATTLLNGADVRAAGERETPTPAALYATFREYRIALRDPRANLSVFFTRRALEADWELLFQAPGERVANTLAAVMARYQFGRRIRIVRAYSVSAHTNGTVELALECSGADEAKVQTVTVEYIQEMHHWMIDFVRIGLSHPVADSNAPYVDRFEN